MVEKLIRKVLEDAQRLNRTTLSWDRVLKDLEKRSRSPKWSTVQLASSFQWLGRNLANASMLAVFRGEDGWGQLAEAAEYFWWKARITRSDLMRGGVSLLAHLVVTGQEARAQWFLDAALRDAAKPTDGSGFVWHSTPFSMLAARLLCQAWNWPLPVFHSIYAKVDGQPFSDVFDHWEDRVRLREAMKAILDRHVRYARSNDDHDFQTPLYTQVYPFEVFLVNHLCRLEGRDELEIEHPLLETPFAAPLPVSHEPVVVCEAAEKIIERARGEGLLGEPEAK